jgi:hypothetical protein
MTFPPALVAWTLLSAALAMSACEGRSSGGDDDAGDDDDGPPIPVVDPHEQCDRYLACLAVAQPEALGAAVTVYGDGGTCWDAGDEYDDLCGLACEEAQRAFWELDPFAAACRIPWPEATLPAGLEPEGYALGGRLPQLSGIDQFGEDFSIGQY